MYKVLFILFNELVGYIYKILLISFKMKFIFFVEDSFIFLVVSIRNIMKILDFYESILELIFN